MKLTLLATDYVNGSRLNKVVEPEEVNKTILAQKKKELLQEHLHSHPEYTEEERQNIEIFFHYRENVLKDVVPRLMPKPLCENCGKTATPTRNGMIICKVCNTTVYSNLYDQDLYDQRHNKKVSEEINPMVEEESPGSVQQVDPGKGQSKTLYQLSKFLYRSCIAFLQRRPLPGVRV